MLNPVFQVLLQPPACAIHERLCVRRREIDLLPPRRHEIPVVEAEADPAKMKAGATVALLLLEIDGIWIDGVADQ